MSTRRSWIPTTDRVVAVLALFVLSGCAARTPNELEDRDIIHDQFVEEKTAIRDALAALGEAARLHNAEEQRLAHLNSPKFTAFGRTSGIEALGTPHHLAIPFQTCSHPVLGSTRPCPMSCSPNSSTERVSQKAC